MYIILIKCWSSRSPHSFPTAIRFSFNICAVPSSCHYACRFKKIKFNELIKIPPCRIPSICRNKLYRRKRYRKPCNYLSVQLPDLCLPCHSLFCKNSDACRTRCHESTSPNSRCAAFSSFSCLDSSLT